MLERMEVRNLALIEALTLEPGPSLNLVTGETGSGKSLLLDALGFVVGARASADLVRAQAESAQVSALFVPPVEWAQRWRPWFEDKGLPWDEGQLLLKRELRRDGKGRAWINASPAPVGVLAELGQALVDFHGQHDHQSLLRVPEHRETLDRFAGDTAALARVEEAYALVLAARTALDGPAGGPEARRRQLEFLDFQARELEELSPKEGEWASLRETCNLQAGAGRRAEALGEADACLNGDEQGALTGLRRALGALQRLPEADPSRHSYERRLESALLELRDLADGLGQALRGVEMDPAALERLQARLHSWESLSRKHRCAPEELAGVWRRLLEERDGLQRLDKDEAGLDRELQRRSADYVAFAQALSQIREKAATLLIKALTAELRVLIGPGAIFTVRLVRREDPDGAFRIDGRPCAGDRRGMDDVEFLFAANPGEQPKALAKIASGGELSRVALALKSVFSKREGAPCLVFDEIDAGISGRVAALVGERIAALAGRHQVFCITHLPQIASLVGRHFKVSKRGAQGRTVVEVDALDAAGREAELATLLGGGDVGASAREHARQLLARPAESVG